MPCANFQSSNYSLVTALLGKVTIYWKVLYYRKTNYFLFIVEFVEAMTDAYPIVEDLLLKNSHLKSIPSTHTSILSAFRFPHLTSLSLSGFQLLDGAALLPVRIEVSFVIQVHFNYFIC